MNLKFFLLIGGLPLLSTLSFAQIWNTDLNSAQAIARAESRPILLVFQGSDWCAPCIKLDKEVWGTNEFLHFAKDQLVLLRADFPRRKKNALSVQQLKHNENLAERYNRNGLFPLAVLIDEQGEVLGEIGYERMTTQAYIEQFQKWMRS